MRALVWCIGVLELVRLMPAELHLVPARGWVWLWGVLLWVLCGAVLVVLPLVRVVTKAGGGAKLPGFRGGSGSSPTPGKGA